jgi:hypothetical protein
MISLPEAQRLQALFRRAGYAAQWDPPEGVRRLVIVDREADSIVVHLKACCMGMAVTIRGETTEEIWAEIDRAMGVLAQELIELHEKNQAEDGRIERAIGPIEITLSGDGGHTG